MDGMGDGFDAPTGLILIAFYLNTSLEIYGYKI